MRFRLSTMLLLLAFALFALAVAPMKSVLVTYPHDTPSHVIEQAKQEVIRAGGIITHEYNLIKGFAADVAQTALDSVQAMGTDYNVLIEEDQIVTANGH